MRLNLFPLFAFATPFSASFHNAKLVGYVKANTKRGKEASATKIGDRPWNDPGPPRWSKKRKQRADDAAIAAGGEQAADGSLIDKSAEKMVLRAIVLDLYIRFMFCRLGLWSGLGGSLRGVGLGWSCKIGFLFSD